MVGPTLPARRMASNAAIPLWPETVAALRAVLKARKHPERSEVTPLEFSSRKFGDPYRPANLSRELGNAMVRAGMRRDEVDFYDLAADLREHWRPG